MTDAVADNSQMPNRSERVDETIRRFESATDRPGSLLELSTPDLFEVGLLLSDRKLSTAEAWRQTNKLLGGDDDNPVVARSTFYRFADRFKALLGQVTAEYAQRIARLSVAEATDDSIRSMTRLTRHRMVELLAEKLVTTDDVDEVLKDLPKLAMALSDAERAQHNADKVELDRLNYERRLSETEAKLDLAEQRSKRLQQQIEDAERKHRQAIESAKAATTKQAKTNRGQLTESDVLSILDQAMKGEL
ncbi:MAG: hypothetical protein AAGA29_05855 [Planctomycetota bacterium]